MPCVFLLTTGCDEEGGGWNLISVHGTEVGATQAKTQYESAPQPHPDGTIYFRSANLIEVWRLDG